MSTIIKKVLLIHPPFTVEDSVHKGAQPPLGLAYLAAVLEREHYEVKIIDSVVEDYHRNEKIGENRFRYGISFEALRQKIIDFNPDLVGVSCPFTIQYDNAKEICRISKECVPGVPVVMGGAHPTSMPEQVMKECCVDVCAIGEADFTFLEMIRAFENGEGFEKIDGIAFRQGGKVITNPKMKFIEDLDTIPFPARHLLPMEKYFQLNKPHGISFKRSPNTSIVSSRGCPLTCNFCSIHTLWGRPFRPRSAENVMAEIRHLIMEYGIREFHFEDDNLTWSKQRAKKLFQAMVDENLDILWSTPNGVFSGVLDKELLELMKKSGCYRIILGIESGSNEVLKNIIGKPQKVEKMKSLIKVAQKAGLEVGGFFVVGLPGETKGQIQETLDFARTSKLDYAGISVATPYPGTKLWEQCQNEGLIKKDLDYNKLFARSANIETKDFTAQEVSREVSKESLRFYIKFALTRPFRFFRIILWRFIRNEPTFFFKFVKDHIMNLFSRA